MTSPGRSRARRTLARANVLWLVVALLAVAVEVGLRLPGDQVLSDLPGLGSSSAAGGQIGPLPRVRTEYLRAVLGEAGYWKLFGAPAAPGAPASGPSARGPEPGAPGAPSPAPRPPETLTGGGLVGGGEWELTVAMTADRATVPPGGEILYRIHVRNIGDGAFPVGTNFEIRWHIPVFTTNAEPVHCALGPIDFQALCPGVVIPTPGTGDATHSSANSFGLIPIGPGEEWVREVKVRVSEVAPPGEIPNHADLNVTGDSAGRITSETVIVVVEPLTGPSG